MKKFFKKIEKYFQKNTYEEFLLHRALLFSNCFLLFLLFIEIFFYWNNIESPFVIRYIEFFFGILFSIELIFFLIHIYIPNKVFFRPRIVINILVIISLIAPNFITNLAFLRLVQSTKIFKIFLYTWQIRKDLKMNPKFKKNKKNTKR